MGRFPEVLSRIITYLLIVGFGILVWYYAIKLSWPYLRMGFRFAMMKIDGMNNYEFFISYLAVLFLILWLEARHKLKKRERRMMLD